MGNCFKPYADQDSQGDSRERLALMHGDGSSRERSASCSDGNSRGRLFSKALSELHVDRSSLDRREGSRLRGRFDGNDDGRQLLLHSQSNSSMPMHADDFEDIRNRAEFVFRAQHPGSGGISKARHGEQVAAGWPAWLSELAGEAVEGWIPRKQDSFERLEKIGQGTYSSVYRARDLEKGKIVALKKVKFDSFDPVSIRFMAREIHILRWLHHPNIIKLEGVATSRMSCTLYLVFEYMEHDLAGLGSRPGLRFTEPQIKCYMKQLLCGLDYCHRRGILHRDIKSSNLLIDCNGVLKIADFGLANFYQQHQVEPMTNRVVTLWYRPPELLLGATYYGTAIDLWSTGCVLVELYAGEPIMRGKTEADQVNKIFKICGSPSEEYWRNPELPHATKFRPQQPYRRRVAEIFKDFPAPTVALIESLLSIDPAARLSAADALNSEFFSSEPLACEPSELPKYPSSKELDAEEARRLARARSKGKRCNDEAEEKAESGAIPAPDANAESAISMSSIVNPNRRFTHEEWRDKNKSIQLEVTKAVRKPGSYNETDDSMRKQGDHRNTQSTTSYANSSRDQLLGDNVSHSGPVLAPPSNLNQMRRDHVSSHVQETSRHDNVDKAKQKRAQGEAIPLPTNSLYVGPNNNRIKR